MNAERDAAIALTLIVLTVLTLPLSAGDSFRFTFMVVHSFVDYDWSLDVYKWLNDTAYAEASSIMGKVQPFKPDAVEARMYIVERSDDTYTGYLRIAFIRGAQVVGWEEKARFSPSNSSWRVLWAEEVYRGDLRGWNAPVEPEETVVSTEVQRVITDTLVTPVTIAETYTYSGSETPTTFTTTLTTTMTVTTTEIVRESTTVTRTLPEDYMGWSRILKGITSLPEVKEFLEQHEDSPMKDVFMEWVSMRDGIVWVSFYAGGREGAWGLTLGYDVRGGSLIYSSGAYTVTRTGVGETGAATPKKQPCEQWSVGVLEASLISIIVLALLAAFILSRRNR